MLHEAAGCDDCEGLGYVGRLGIFEFLEMTEELRDLTREKRGTQAIAAAARAGGMATMLQYGLRKCLAGDTTFAEVTRVAEDW
jgi:general secretion pathway protein E